MIRDVKTWVKHSSFHELKLIQLSSTLEWLRRRVKLDAELKIAFQTYTTTENEELNMIGYLNQAKNIAFRFQKDNDVWTGPKIVGRQRESKIELFGIERPSVCLIV